MLEIDVSADQIVSALLRLPQGRNICILDSCGVGRAGSNRLIAGIDPVEKLELTGDDPDQTLRTFEDRVAGDSLAAVFTISYDFGLKLNRLGGQRSPAEPDISLSLFDALIIHHYDQERSFLAGRHDKFNSIEKLLFERSGTTEPVSIESVCPVLPQSNFTRAEYIRAVVQIKELIRSGETYQTNLTQRFEVPLGEPAAHVFAKLRRDHPAPFAAFIDRGDSTVVSASPEEFIRIETFDRYRTITASPIKGTRPRGDTPDSDERLRNELLTSEKDRAENTMIVDLMRNDLGRVCEFGSVAVADLCRLEEHPTLFHLVSTVTGDLRNDASFSDVIRAVFPCGSITGAPKIRTMKVIDSLETAPRGLSMGAIGCRIPKGFGNGETLEMSVAIRTMVIRNEQAVFNVGGGIVIDSDPAAEYDESMLKAKALMRALGAVTAPGGTVSAK